MLHLPDNGLARLEYQLELSDHDGDTVVVCDPGNPQRAPGAFGEKSVLSAPGYHPPAWLERPFVGGDRGGRPPGARPRPGDQDLVSVRGRTAAARRARRARVRRARRADPLRRRDDRGWHASAVSRRAAASRRPRRVVLGVGDIRPGAVQPGPAAIARARPRDGPAGGHGREPRRPRDAPGSAELAWHVRRPVPAVGELLRAPLRPPGVGFPALRPDRAVRPRASCAPRRSTSRCRSR